MFKKLLILLAAITALITSCSSPNFDVFYSGDNYGSYLSTDHIIIVPHIFDGLEYVEYTLDDTHIHTLYEMPFALELEADTLSTGVHSVKIRHHMLPSDGVTFNKTSSITFEII